MSKIKKPNELSVQVHIKALIYGQPGIGKTTLGLSSPEPLLIDCDRGVHRVSTQVLKDTVEVENYSDIDEVLREDLSAYKTLVFDTGGKLIDFMTEFLISNNPKFAQADGTFSLKGYGARKIMFQQLLTRITMLRKHVVFIAHEREDKDGDNRFVRPEIGGSSGNDLIKELDMVGYMEAVGKVRTLHFNPQQKFYAKNSIALPDQLKVQDIKNGNTFLSGIFQTYQQDIERRQAISLEYLNLIDDLRTKIESCKDASSANMTIDYIKNIEHIWDSRLWAAKLLRKQANALNLSLNSDYLYEDPKTTADEEN